MTTSESSGPEVQDLVTGIMTVGIPVSDQDRALEFYVGVLGMQKALEAPTPDGGRWLVVAPRAGGTTVALVAAGDGLPKGVETGIRFATRNAERTRESLAASGAEVGDILRWPGVPAMFSFRDPDGNGLEAVEPAASDPAEIRGGA